VHVMEGRVRLETESGSSDLPPGSAIALGAGRWCSIHPLPFTRMWTLYLDENFLRAQMRWILADSTHVRPGIHPDSWDGSAIIMRPGLHMFRRNEPIWRQISVVGHAEAPELTTTRLIALFTRTVEFSLPALLTRKEQEEDHQSRAVEFPLKGTLTQHSLSPHLHLAVVLLRERMAEPWTMQSLSVQLAMSRSHLTRLFNDEVGVAPMRFLTEVRLTEFTRLIDETPLPVSSAARDVGWADARIATRWFSRRFGMTPSEYRQHPHPVSADEQLAESRHDDIVQPTGPASGRARDLTRDSRSATQDSGILSTRATAAR